MINLYLCSATSKLRALCTRRPFLIKIIAREQSVQHRASPFPVESVIGVILEDEHRARIKHLVLGMPGGEFGPDRVPGQLEELDPVEGLEQR